jgi:nitrite reductase (NO-forming)/hydroxylamine reductase
MIGVAWGQDGAPPQMTPEEFEQGKQVYFDRCAGCHGTLRKGATGPNITDERMLKKSLAQLEKTIFEGTDAGMPGWGKSGEMTEQQTKLMAKYVQNPVPVPPELSLKEMKQSHKLFVPTAQRPAAPEHQRTIDNLMGVILRDVGQGAIIDGDTKELMSVVKTGFAVHIFRASSSGRYFYTVGRDGKVTLIDLFAAKPQVVAEVKVCSDARSIDVSKYNGPKGNFVDKLAVVGCYWPPQMVVVDGQTLEPLKIVSTRSITYDTNEYHPEPRVATIVASHFDSEWVIAIKETGMVWLVDYSDLDNLRMTQIAAERFLHDGGWDATKRYLLVAANMRDQIVVIDTKDKKFVTKFETGIKPHPGRGANWVDPKYGPVSATVHLGEGKLTVYGSDPAGYPQHAWQVVHEGKTPGPGLFLKTHPVSNHIWADSALAKEAADHQTICVFRKDAFTQGPNCFRPTNHGRIVHFEYNKAGTEVWASVWDRKGEIIVYDDKTLKEIKRLSGDWLVTPTGKWNVYNTVHDIY